MVYIKTIWDEVVLDLKLDPTTTTLRTLKVEIGKKWIIQTILQKLYFVTDVNLDYNEIIINDPLMELRDDFYGGDKLFLSQLGVMPCSTLLLIGPVLRPKSFFTEAVSSVAAASDIVSVAPNQESDAEAVVENYWDDLVDIKVKSMWEEALPELSYDYPDKKRQRIC